MVLPVLNHWPGQVVDVEIHHRFGSPINFDPASRLLEFFLVLSMGRCKFRLTPVMVGLLLQSVLGVSSHACRVVQLGDRVFRFSIASKLVGFYIFKLKSFECSEFKALFHLWHG